MTASADPNDPQRVLLGQLNRIYGVAGKTECGRPATITASTDSSSIERGRQLMKAIHKAVVSAAVDQRFACWWPAALAATLAGCYQTDVAQIEYPTDYRQRHPIALREGVQSVEVLVGRNRGGLTPSQRADVLVFAQAWRHEASSGIIIDVPRGGPTDHAAADAIREIRSIFAAVGVPPNAIYVRHYRPSRFVAREHQAQLFASWSRRRDRAGSGRSISDRRFDSGYIENQPYWNLGCATQRNLAAMVDNPADLVQPRGETPPYAPRRSSSDRPLSQGRKPVRHLCRLRPRQNQRCRKMIKDAQQVAVAENTRMPAPAERQPTRTSRRRRGSRCRLFARRSKPRPPSRPPAKTGASAKAHVKIQMGGIAAATEAYRNSPTPNVILIETDARADDILSGLDQLAEVCDARHARDRDRPRQRRRRSIAS